MMRKMFCLGCLCLAVGLSPVRAGVIAIHSANGAVIKTSIDVGFQDILPFPTGSIDAASDVQFNGAPPIAGSTVLTTASANRTPNFGSGTATGTVTTKFTYDTADSIAFDGTITLSALSAANVLGGQADAFVAGGGVVTFSLDKGIAPLFTVVGDITLNPPGAMQLHETLRQVSFVTDTFGILGTPSLTVLLAGEPGQTLPLTAGLSYSISFGYEARVPFGTDPIFTPSFTVTIIPEPSSVVLLTIGSIGLWRRRRV